MPKDVEVINTPTDEYTITVKNNEAVIKLGVRDGKLVIEHTSGNATPPSVTSILNGIVISLLHEPTFQKLMENAREAEAQIRQQNIQQSTRPVDSGGGQRPQSPAKKTV